jgi:hypothetical protein
MQSKQCHFALNAPCHFDQREKSPVAKLKISRYRFEMTD